MEKELEIRVKRLEQRFDVLSSQLKKALVYIEDDPPSSLTKSRTILEQILLNIYKLEMNMEPKRIELGAILTDNQFTRKIDKRIVSRMNAIRDLCNLGVHGEEVNSKDAKIVLDNLCEVLEWYFENYRVIKTENRILEQTQNIDKNSNSKRRILFFGIFTLALTVTIFIFYFILKSTKIDVSTVSEKIKNSPYSSMPKPSLNINKSKDIDSTETKSKTTSQNLTNQVIEEKPVESFDENTLLDSIENRRYKTARIGNQIWMAKNLSTAKLNDGTPIPLVTDKNTWNRLTTLGYCWYDNQNQNGNTSGALYNWYTVNTGKLCPKGWHVPSDKEWTTLIDYLGGEYVAGGKLKETGTAHWISPNTGATNEKGFMALPGGLRSSIGIFERIGFNGLWWSSTEDSLTIARARLMFYDLGHVTKYNSFKKDGFSVRCVRD
jgi:uncharacterized protein (TIGR02145 family)